MAIVGEKAIVIPEFYDGKWYGLKDVKDNKSREMITESTFDETVYFRFKSNILNADEVTAEVKEHNTTKKDERKLLKVDVKNLQEVKYIKEIDGSKKNEKDKIYEAEIKLDKEKYQKNGNELILHFGIETKEEYEIKKSKKKIKNFLPESDKNYLNVGPGIKLVRLRVHVLDCIKGTAIKNSKVSSVKIRGGLSEELRIFFNEFDTKISESKDKYSNESVQKALNSFYHLPLPAENKEFYKLHRIYDCGDPFNKFDNAKSKQAYERYLKDRGYLYGDSGSGAVKALGRDDVTPPLIVRKVILDEYNGMSGTDDRGYLYISIPVDKYLNKRELSIEIEFSRADAFIENVYANKSFVGKVLGEVHRVHRKKEGDNPKEGETGFKIFWNGKWLAENESGGFLNKKKSICNFDRTVKIILNTSRHEIKDYYDIELYNKFKNDFSIFYKRDKEEEKQREQDNPWMAKNYPGMRGKQPHIALFLMTCWDSREHASYWKNMILNVIKPEKHVLLRKGHSTDKTEFDDDKINIIGIRRGGLKHAINVNRPNDIFIVIADNDLQGIFYGSTEPGEVGHSTLKTGQHTNYTRRLIWKKSNSITLFQDYNIGSYTPTTKDANRNGVVDDGDIEGAYSEGGKNFKGDPNILFHYGGRGFEYDYKNFRWEWNYVNGISWGCQVVCGSHHIENNGELFKHVLNKLSRFKYEENPDENLGAYDVFSDIWNNKHGDKEITYTLIDEDNIPFIERTRYYKLYRDRLFFRV